MAISDLTNKEFTELTDKLSRATAGWRLVEHYQTIGCSGASLEVHDMVTELYETAEWVIKSWCFAL